MTTIAFDGRFLAADTLATRGGNSSNCLSTKIALAGGRAFAFGGAWGPLQADLMNWYLAGAEPAQLPSHARHSDGGTMLVLDLETRVPYVFTDKMPYADQEAAPIAFGTGGDLAQGAIRAGVTAMEAVQIAALDDLMTNDTIDFIDCEHPELGVQRWDGCMPSKAFPMPLHAVAPSVIQSVRAEHRETVGFTRTIPKPRKRTHPDYGNAYWNPSECTGRLTLGTGCGHCLRCNREWHVLLKQPGALLVDGALQLSDGPVIPPKPSVALGPVCDHGYVATTCTTCNPTRKGTLAAWVSEYNAAVDAGDVATMAALNVDLRSMTFPPDVELVRDLRTGKQSLTQKESA
jgi:hypothetical protein